MGGVIGTRSTLALLATPLFLACQRAPATSSPASGSAATSAHAPLRGLTVHDDSQVFLGFWQKARGEDPSARIARYKAEVVPGFPRYWEYVAATSENGGAAKADSSLDKQLGAFDKLEPRYAQVAKRAPKELDVAIKAMRARFPDFDPQVEVRLIHSLGRMDGGTRVLGGRYHLLFGIDMIAQLHTWADDRAFFAHELFHTYSDQRHQRDGRNPHPVEAIDEENATREQPLYATLWDEGLATYVSEWAVPGASRASMLLEIPENLIPGCTANLPFLVGDLAAKLDSRDVADYGDYFTFRSKDPRRPKRAGYYIGYLVAKRLHRTMPMEALVSLEGAQLRKEISGALPALVEVAASSR
jgi:hypothetical protein